VSSFEFQVATGYCRNLETSSLKLETGLFSSASSAETHFQPLEIVILSEAKNLLFPGARTITAGPSSAVADSG
jgi:hypothetical protein